MTKDRHRGLTARRLREVLYYDPITGMWTWTVTLSARRMAGAQAGEIKPSGYVLIGIDGHRYRAHRLAVLYMTGSWPKAEVDHRDTVRSHNWWTNLRPAESQQNGANRGANKNNTSGFKGVFWSKQRQKWAAKINPDRRQVHLGFYQDPLDAHAAYAAACAKYYGEFGRAA